MAGNTGQVVIRVALVKKKGKVHKNYKVNVTIFFINTLLTNIIITTYQLNSGRNIGQVGINKG